MPGRPVARPPGLTILLGGAFDDALGGAFGSAFNGAFKDDVERPLVRGAWHVTDLERAAAPLGIAVRVTGFTTFSSHLAAPEKPWRVQAGDVPLRLDNPILVRMMPRGSLEQVIFRMDVLHTLVAEGARVINSPRALETAIDKYLGAVRLRGAGLPVPATLACENPRAASEAFAGFGGDAVIKPLFGSEGRGVVRIRSESELEGAVAACERDGAVLLMQEFIPHDGCDYRVFVVAGEPLGAMQRRAAASWVTNIAQGGMGEAVNLPAPALELAIRAAAAVGAEVAGVDLLQDGDGRWWVLEVNAVPGWRAFAAVTGIDVAAVVVGHAIRVSDGNAIATG